MSFARLSRLLFVSLCCIAHPALAAVTVLYDHGLGGTPAAQAWLAGARTGGSESVTPEGTLLDTRAGNGIYAGYSNYNFGIQIAPPDVFPTSFKNTLFPVLDPAAGFTLSVSMQLSGLANDCPN